MKMIRKTKTYSAITLDINNYCNASCKYCFNTFEKDKGNMDLQTFKKVMESLPFLSGPFILGCFFEPTANSEYNKLIKNVPVQYSNKIQLQTNLLEKMSKEDIKEIAQSKINELTISFNFIKPENIKKHQGVKEFYFFENLENIKKIFNKAINPPKIRFMTLILNSNSEEIISLAEYVKTNFEKSEHIFLTPYYDINNKGNIEYLESELLERADLDNTEQLLRSVDESIVFWTGLDKENYYIEKEKEKIDRNENVNYIRLPKEDTYTLKIDYKGNCLFYGNKETINLNDVESPFKMFSQQLIKLQHNEAEKNIVEIPQIIKNCSYNIESSIEEVVEYDYLFSQVIGWVNVSEYFMEEINVYILLEDGENQYFYKTEKVKRPDVAEHFHMDSALYSGFKTIIEKKEEWLKKDLKVYFVFEDTVGSFYKKESKQTISFFIE